MKQEIYYVETHVLWLQPCPLQTKMAEDIDVNIADRKYLVLNYGFEDILDTLGDRKETENDFEEVSELVSNTKVIYYACFLFDQLF